MIFVIQVLANFLALFLSEKLIKEVEFTNRWYFFLVIGIFIGTVNYLAKPFFKTIWSGLFFFNLAIFSFLLNAGLLLIIIILVPGFSVIDFWPSFWMVLIISLVNYSIGTVIGYK